MPQVAYLCGADTVRKSPNRRLDAYEHDVSFRQLEPAFALAGRSLVEVCWSDSSIDLSRFEAAIVGTTWDYIHVVPYFLTRLTSIASQIKLFNDLEMIRWNIDKRYMRDLAEQGIAIIPTIWRSKLGDTISDQDFEALGAEKIIIKPTVGNCSEGQIVVRRGEGQCLASQAGRSVMIQKFYETISGNGEKSLIFFGNAYSHSVLKRPALGDYRVQSIFGGTERVYTPTERELLVCENILSKLASAPLYARVDLVDLPSGDLALMECELIEPYLYPTYSSDDSRAFVRQYLARC